jgi:hypothetical protein
MLYRPGSQIRVWDAHNVDTLIVLDEAEEAAALQSGWSIAPDPLDRDGNGARGGSRKRGPKK